MIEQRVAGHHGGRVGLGIDQQDQLGRVVTGSGGPALEQLLTERFEIKAVVEALHRHQTRLDVIGLQLLEPALQLHRGGSAEQLGGIDQVLLGHSWVGAGSNGPGR